MPTKISEAVQRSLAMAKSLRQPWEGDWQRLMDLAMPYRTSFFTPAGSSRNGAPIATIYDETGMVGLEECSNRLLSGIMPQGSEWGRLEWARGESAERKAQLATVQDYLFRTLERSNFEPEASETFLDLSGFGNCCLAVDGGDWATPLEFTAIPLPDWWITPGVRGNWADIHVRFRKPAYAVRAEWPNADLPPGFGGAQKADNVEVYESWIRDLGSPVERWRWECHVDGNVLARGGASGQGSCRFLVGRWGKAAGELYAVGPGMQALPSMGVLNEAVRLILANGEMALTGMYQAEDDGVLNPYAVELIPGTIVPIAPGSKGLTPLQPPSTRLDLGGLVLDEHRLAIRKALFNEQLGPRTGTPPTAFEIRERMAELARQIGPSYGRVWRELAVPLIQRALRVLKQDGRIAVPVVDGRKLRVVATSELVRSAAAQEMRGVNEWLADLAAFYGPTAIASVVPLERYVALSSRKRDIPADLPYTPTEMAANAERLGAMFGQAAEAAQGGNAAAQALLSQFGGAK